MGTAAFLALRFHHTTAQRVSTDHQTTENQERELLERAERAGWEVVKVYRDHGVSGAKSGKDRRAFSGGFSVWAKVAGSRDMELAHEKRVVAKRFCSTRRRQ